MAGIRKMIYTPSQEVWDRIRDAAWRENRTISNFLINLFYQYEKQAQGIQPAEIKLNFKPEPKKDDDKTETIKNIQNDIDDRGAGFKKPFVPYSKSKQLGKK